MEQSPLFWIFNILVVMTASALTIYCARNRKGSGGYLCEDCRFNRPADCLKSVRPFALVCTSYRQANDGHALIAESPVPASKESTASSASTTVPTLSKEEEQ
jgi:hypothetical protein